MNPATQQFLMNLTIGVMVAFMSAFVTVHLAFRRFSRERWWDRRAEAYSIIIESVYNMKHFADEWLEREQQQRADETGALPADIDEQVRTNRLAAEASIRRAIALGSYFFSARAAADLNKLQQELYAARRAYEQEDQAQQESEALGKYLQIMQQHAKRDLQIQRYG